MNLRIAYYVVAFAISLSAVAGAYGYASPSADASADSAANVEKARKTVLNTMDDFRNANDANEANLKANNKAKADYDKASAAYFRFNTDPPCNGDIACVVARDKRLLADPDFLATRAARDAANDALNDSYNKAQPTYKAATAATAAKEAAQANSAKAKADYDKANNKAKAAAVAAYGMAAAVSVAAFAGAYILSKRSNA